MVVLSPHDAWLLIRGLRTLELRANRSADNAAFVLSGLKGIQKLKAYISRSTKAIEHTLARKQMKRCSGHPASQ